MIQAKNLYAALRGAGVERYCGVPDSTLNAFSSYLVDHAPVGSHRICPNEGNAVARASGHYLASGQPGCVYMQNSGLGNAVNPLASLTDPEVYAIPMLLVVGWRGRPGIKDEPQHRKQGRITLPQLEALEIPYHILPQTEAELDACVRGAVQQSMQISAPVALVLEPGTLAGYDRAYRADTSASMHREQAVRIISQASAGRDFVVATTGKVSRELFECRCAQGGGQDRDFLTVGSMGHASHIALGLAEARPDVGVICLDGDGAVVMHMGALAAIAEAAPANLTHLVINNRTHDSVGGLPTCGKGLDLCALARVCGYPRADRVDSPEALRRILKAREGSRGLSFIEVLVRPGARDDLGRPDRTPVENRDAFMAALGRQPV